MYMETQKQLRSCVLPCLPCCEPVTHCLTRASASSLYSARAEMTIEGLIGLVDHIKESTAPREERAAVDSLSSALNTLGSSSGESSGAAMADCEADRLLPSVPVAGCSSVERRAQEEARRAQEEVEALRRLVQRRKEEAQQGNEALRRSNEKIQELQRQCEEEGIDTAHIKTF